MTEVIGCDCADPKAVQNHRTEYYPTQYGYNPSNASHKFIRMRSNNGILPIDTIRGGQCAGRTDGLCPMENFLASQESAYALSNYDYACFGNWTLNDPTDGHDYDGTIFTNTSGVTHNS